MPLRPDPMVTQDGTATHAGARTAATRVLGQLRQEPPLQVVSTAASRSARAPHSATLQAQGRHSLLGVNAGAQASLCQQGQVAELWKQEYWHIAPRAGFAYRLRSDTVIRGATESSPLRISSITWTFSS